MPDAEFPTRTVMQHHNEVGEPLCGWPMCCAPVLPGELYVVVHHRQAVDSDDSVIVHLEHFAGIDPVFAHQPMEVVLGKKLVERIPDLTHEQYQALSEEEKEARKAQWDAYDAQFEPGHYPVRDQLNSHNQRFADSQRAMGINPPGVYL